MKSRWLAPVLGFSGVALGAFGAHGLKGLLTASNATGIWETAVFYHLIHAAACLWGARFCQPAAWLWGAGVFVFSGSLYLLALTGVRWLGATTPLGGLLLLAGWLAAFLPGEDQPRAGSVRSGTAEGSNTGARQE